MIDELEHENRLIRARNERLEAERNHVLARNQEMIVELGTALARIEQQELELVRLRAVNQALQAEVSHTERRTIERCAQECEAGRKRKYDPYTDVGVPVREHEAAACAAAIRALQQQEKQK